MKLSLLLRSLIVPFLMFALLGIDCPGEDDEPNICKSFKTTKENVKRLEHNVNRNVEIVTNTARADCNATFTIRFGWDHPDQFTSANAPSPLNKTLTLANFDLTLGEKNFGKTFKWDEAGPVKGVNPDGEEGYVWSIVLPVEPVASEGSTRFFVRIEHDIVDAEYDIFVDAEIEYSSE